MNEYLLAWKRIADYSGRSTRREFWMFCLGHLVLTVVLLALGSRSYLFDTIRMLYGYVVFFPILALSIRRLHDTGRSGWWILLMLIPLIGAIVLLVFYTQPTKVAVVAPMVV